MEGTPETTSLKNKTLINTGLPFAEIQTQGSYLLALTHGVSFASCTLHFLHKDLSFSSFIGGGGRMGFFFPRPTAALPESLQISRVTWQRVEKFGDDNAQDRLF